MPATIPPLYREHCGIIGGMIDRSGEIGENQREGDGATLLFREIEGDGDCSNRLERRKYPNLRALSINACGALNEGRPVFRADLVRKEDFMDEMARIWLEA